MWHICAWLVQRCLHHSWGTMPFTDVCFLFIQWPDSLNHADDERASGHLEECVHTIWGVRFYFYPWLSGGFFLSSCESLFEMFSPRQPYGSRPHLSSSKKRLRSTCLYLPTAQRPSQACCRNTPSLMSKMPAWQLRKLTAAKFRKRKNG